MAKKLVTGGRKVRQWIREAKRNASKPVAVEIGFFPSARYRTGKREPVAAVAALHEYGLDDLPERAFLRRSVPESAPKVRAAIRAGLRGRSLDHPLTLPPNVAKQAGEAVADRIRANIEALRTPPNKPGTIARKGSRNPLLDSQTMRDSVEVRLAREGRK